MSVVHIGIVWVLLAVVDEGGQRGGAEVLEVGDIESRAGAGGLAAMIDIEASDEAGDIGEGQDCEHDDYGQGVDVDKPVDVFFAEHTDDDGSEADEYEDHADGGEETEFGEGVGADVEV